MIKGDTEYLLIEKAYEEFLKFNRENPESIKGAKKCTFDFYENINQWDGISSLDNIIRENLVGKLADCVASVGPGGKMGQQDFYIFMNNENTKKQIVKLLQIKQKNNLRVDDKINFKEVKNIQDVKLLALLECYEPVINITPKILVQRFMCIFFNEIFTSIANYNDAVTVAKKLNIISKSKKASELECSKFFELLQFEIRYKIDEYFSLKGEPVDNHVKFFVAWFIKDIK